MKTITILILPLLFCLSCSKPTELTEKQKIDKEIEAILPKIHAELSNDCLIVASNVSSAIKAKHALIYAENVKILAFEYINPPYGPLCHAVAVFTFPNKSKIFYIYDEKVGSKMCYGDLNFLLPTMLAKKAYPKYNVTRAFYLPN